MKIKIIYLLALTVLFGYIWKIFILNTGSELAVGEQLKSFPIKSQDPIVPPDNSPENTVTQRKNEEFETNPSVKVDAPHTAERNQQEITPFAGKNTVEISEVENDGSLDVSGVDADLAKNGLIFSANLDDILELSEGAELDIKFLGQQYSGVVKKKEISQIGDPFISISLGETGGMASIYYGKDIKMGNFYTANGQYVFEQRGKVGYIMNMYEYKKIKNALGQD